MPAQVVVANVHLPFGSDARAAAAQEAHASAIAAAATSLARRTNASLALVATVGLTRREACESYSYDFSYWYDDEATPPPTAQESSPVAPDDPLGLPEDSATAAPTTESDGTLGRRLAAACVLAALLL